MNVYDRLSNLFAYICNQDFPATISNLAKAMNVYEEQIAQDIAFLESFEMPKGNPIFKQHMSITLVGDEPCYHMKANAFVHYSNLFIEKEDYDSPVSRDYTLCHMSYLENAFFKYIIEHNGVDYLHNNYDYYTFPLIVIPKLLNNENNISDNLDTIEKAINLGAQIKFDYQGMSGLYLIPHLIMRDINTSQLYVIQIPDKEDYLDDIEPEIFALSDIDLAEIMSPQESDISPEALSLMQSCWSFEPEYLDNIMKESPRHVRLKIFEDNADIITKIKADTSCRIKGCLSGPFLDGDDPNTNIYYYEDDIVGMEAFKKWTLQFGKSMVVLEPKELAIEIYRELVNVAN